MYICNVDYKLKEFPKGLTVGHKVDNDEQLFGFLPLKGEEKSQVVTIDKNLTTKQQEIMSILNRNPKCFQQTELRGHVTHTKHRIILEK